MHDYIGRWRISPSLGEIAAEFGVSRVQAHRAVESLSSSGLLVKRPGPRGLALPSACDEAVRLLTDMGLRAGETGQGVTNQQLLTMPPLDYIPPRTRGDRHGQQVKTGS